MTLDHNHHAGGLPPPDHLNAAAGDWAGQVSEIVGPPGSVDSRVDECRAWLGEFFADFGEGGGIRLATLDPAGGGWCEYRRGLRPVPKVSPEEFLDAAALALVQEAEKGIDVFACPYLHPGSRRRGGATSRKHVHADVDGPLDLSRVRFVGGMAVASGGLAEDGVTPRGHVYVRLSESVPVHLHEALCRGLGQVVGGERHDPSKTSDVDVLRPAGTLNHKPDHGPEPRPVRWLIGPDDDRVKSWDPQTLARLLGLGWPIPEPADSLPLEVTDGPSSSLGLNSGGLTERRLDGLARSVESAPTGQGNDRLNKCAGVAAAICATVPDAPPGDDVRAALIAAYLARPVPPGESARSRERQAVATVASGWRWGSSHLPEALADRRPTMCDTEEDDENSDDAVTLHAVDETPGDDASAQDQTATDGETDPLTRARARFHLYDRAALEAMPEPVETVGGVLPATGALVVVTGTRGLGKSLMTLDLAGTLSCGLDHWHDPVHAVTQHGPVLYVAREGFHGVPRRVRAWEAEHGHRLDAVTWLPSPMDLKRHEDARDLALIAADLGAVMVVTDSARATGAGKEDTDDMGAFVVGLESVAKHSGALVLTLHNTGWDDTRGRGSTLLPDAADTVLHLEGRADPSAVRTLKHHKHRDGDMLDGLRFRFRKVEGTDSGVLVPTDAATEVTARREDNRQAVETARLSVLMARICEVLAPSRADASRAMSGRKVGDHLRAAGVRHTTTDLRAALAGLEADGHVTGSPHRLVRPFYVVTPEGAEVPK